MKLEASADIAADPAAVWAALTDLEAAERGAMARGVDVTRLREPLVLAPGMTWRIDFPLRGRRRRAEAGLTEIVPAERIAGRITGEGVEARATGELLALARHRTRLLATVEFAPKGIRGRLALQTLALARAGLEKRFRDRVARFAARFD